MYFELTAHVHAPLPEILRRTARAHTAGSTGEAPVLAIRTPIPARDSHQPTARAFGRAHSSAGAQPDMCAPRRLASRQGGRQRDMSGAFVRQNVKACMGGRMRPLSLAPPFERGIASTCCRGKIPRRERSKARIHAKPQHRVQRRPSGRRETVRRRTCNSRSTRSAPAARCRRQPRFQAGPPRAISFYQLQCLHSELSTNLLPLCLHHTTAIYSVPPLPSCLLPFADVHHSYRKRLDLPSSLSPALLYWRSSPHNPLTATTYFLSSRRGGSATTRLVRSLVGGFGPVGWAEQSARR